MCFWAGYQCGEWGLMHAEDLMKNNFENAPEIFSQKMRGWSISLLVVIPYCRNVVSRGINSLEILGYLCSRWVALHCFGESCEEEKQSHLGLLEMGERQHVRNCPPQLCWNHGSQRGDVAQSSTSGCYQWFIYIASSTLSNYYK